MHSPKVAILGAGFSGLGMAVNLRKEGITSFTIYERLPAAGGCWRSNAFPGAEVDTDSDVYRFSFKPYPWTRSHARRHELLAYFDEVIEEHDLRGHMRFDTNIESVEWVEGSGYVLTSDDGTIFDADVVISAVGLFSEPQVPPWPGLESFTGDVVHSAQWREDVDLRGRTVAVVGTGSTSASLVPALAEHAERLLVFQRQPGWILPKPVTEYDAHARRQRSRRLTADWNRLKALYRIRKAIRGGAAKKVGTAQNKAVQAVAEKFLRDSFADRPDLLSALTPDYPIYGKRVVRSSEFYPALKRSNVELVPCGIREVTATGVIDDHGKEHRLDALVLATGFKASEFLSEIHVVGRDGTTLRDAWGLDASAFLGMMVPGFPNFFMLYGPNTNGSGAHLFVLECQMGFVAGVVGRLRKGDVTAEVRRSHFDGYERWLDRQWADSALLTTHNYFRSSTGRVVTNWPRGFGLYYALTKLGRLVSVRYDKAAARARQGRWSQKREGEKREGELTATP
jgi:cation diffusion facilitator CzcD-associated flavoprotein CzcO